MDLRVQALVSVCFCVLCHDLSYETNSIPILPAEAFSFHDRRNRATITAIMHMSSVAIDVAVSILAAFPRGRNVGSPRSVLYVCSEGHIMILGLRTSMPLFLGTKYRSAVLA